MKNLLFFYIFMLFMINAACIEKVGKNVNSEIESKPLMRDEFLIVCGGGKIEKSAPYEKQLDTISPAILFDKPENSSTFRESSFLLTEAWQARYPNYEKTQLVACSSFVSKKKVKTCTYSQRSDIGPNLTVYGDEKKTLILHNAKINLQVYESKTGNLITEKVFDLEADKKCPESISFGKDEKVKSSQPSLSIKEVNEFLRPFVAP